MIERDHPTPTTSRPCASREASSLTPAAGDDIDRIAPPAALVATARVRSTLEGAAVSRLVAHGPRARLCCALANGAFNIPLNNTELGKKSIARKKNCESRGCFDHRGGSMSTYVLGLREVDRSQLAIVGGKGANLGELSTIHGLQVPDGFCVTTDAYRKVTEQHQELDGLLHELALLQARDNKAIGELSTRIRSLIERIA